MKKQLHRALAGSRKPTPKRGGSVAMLLGLLFPFAGLQAQMLTTQNNLTPQQLVETILVGQGVTVSNVTFNGQPGNTISDQVGSFNGTGSNLGLAEGIVLATGKVGVVDGPNMTPSSNLGPSQPNTQADPDLGHFVYTQRDIAVLEFDFVPTGDTLSFRFIFGSEEYQEYVCSSYNDGFGFFLSGPGINGPFSNNGVNLAVLPGTNVPVAINTVNSGTPGVLGNGAPTCAAADPNWQSNSIYYVDNDFNVMNPWASSVELDGFTVPLNAGARVECGQTYHIKIAIADATDPNLDSAVFIEGGSFESAAMINASVTTTATPMGDNTLTEGCGDAVVTITTSAVSGDKEILLAYGGDGITEGDLSGTVDHLIIPDGESQGSFTFQAIRDGQAEGSEELMIVATWNSGCGGIVTDTVMITLLDYEPMVLTPDDLWLECDQDSVSLHVDVVGGLGEVTLAWGSDGEPGPYYVSGLDDGSYTVVATDQCPESVGAQVTVNSGCSAWVPNVFSPNNDGHNDTFIIGGLSRGTLLKVFNRWGNVIYESPNYGNNWKANGVPDGTYYYFVKDGRTGKEYTGHLTIVGNGK